MFNSKNDLVNYLNDQFDKNKSVKVKSKTEEIIIYRELWVDKSVKFIVSNENSKVIFSNLDDMLNMGAHFLGYDWIDQCLPEVSVEKAN